MRNAKPLLERSGSNIAAEDLDAASEGHTIIKKMLENGATGYGLVVLVATLDDLSLNSARGTTALLTLEIKAPTEEVPGSLLILSSSGTECNDISELLLHSTLRFISVEENVLAKAFQSKESPDSRQPASH